MTTQATTKPTTFRPFVRDVILEVISKAPGCSFSYILEEMQKHPRGSLRGSATCVNSLSRYLQELEENEDIFRPFAGAFAQYKERWTPAEVREIAWKAFPDAERVKPLPDEATTHRVMLLDIVLKKHAYIKRLEIPDVEIDIHHQS